ncbi:hypothetical protein [Haloferula sp.]|uniref:hypothetical protein n=1 Tax=Haloferula sp. TaxID=2497595 RepID=UPI00329E81B9
MKALALIPLLALPVLNAQETTSSMSMEERKASVVQLKNRIEMREERLNELVADIKTLDDRTEKRIEKVVSTLKDTQDSQSSKTRITKLKTDVIEGLRNSIAAYQAERRKIFEAVRVNKDEAAKPLLELLSRLDERVQKRADQIMELAKSMPQRDDVKKYERDGGRYYNGYHYENSRISEKWRQNRRQGSATKVEIDDLMKALESAIDTLERRKMAIEARINGGQLSPANLELAQFELGQTDAMLDHRKREMLELAKPQGTSGQAANKDSADHLKDLFDNVRGDISEDHWNVLKKLNDAVQEQDAIIKLKANLAAREKWLEENAGE